jgi:hypothetical protein
VRFDTICEILVSDLAGGGGQPRSLTLLRRDGFSTEPLTVEVRM